MTGDIKIKVNRESGVFLVRSNSIGVLPAGITRLGTVPNTVDIMTVLPHPEYSDIIACYYDHNDFQHALPVTFFELEALIRHWLVYLGLSNGEWIRVDILVENTETQEAVSEQEVEFQQG